MPEEINRVMADHLSALLFCPTQTALVNLAKEGITAGVHAVGDVMYDVTLAGVKRAADRSRILEALRLSPRSYAVATVHRAENTDDSERFARVLGWLGDQARETQVIMPVHPRTRKLMESHNLRPRGVTLINPLGYLDMAWLLHNSDAVFTDSGGLQKEAYFHGVPCVTLRDETEWVETVEAGWNRLWTVPTFRPRRSIDDYGEGRSSEAIASVLAGTV
jgi:UDP-GlcNAc3NAcA epimerase